MMGHFWNLLALMAKDLRLHRRELGLAFVTWFGLAALWVYSQAGRPINPLVPVFLVNAMASSFWGEWLISREKTKGTFLWLRTLPIGDAELVASKFASQAIWCSALWIPSSLLLAPGALTSDGWPTWGVVSLILLVGGAVVVATRWRFQQKMAQAAPMVAAPLLAIGFLIADAAGLVGTRVLADWWATSAGKATTAALLAATYGATIWATGAWVSRSETTRFLE